MNMYTVDLILRSFEMVDFQYSNSEHTWYEKKIQTTVELSDISYLAIDVI